MIIGTKGGKEGFPFVLEKWDSCLFWKEWKEKVGLSK